MTKTISVRLDAQAQEALRLMEAGGMGRSEAIRKALVQAASRNHRQLVEAEVAQLVADPGYRREVEEVQALMEELSAPWPDP